MQKCPNMHSKHFPLYLCVLRVAFYAKCISILFFIFHVHLSVISSALINMAQRCTNNNNNNTKNRVWKEFVHIMQHTKELIFLAEWIIWSLKILFENMLHKHKHRKRQVFFSAKRKIKCNYRKHISSDLLLLLKQTRITLSLLNC